MSGELARMVLLANVGSTFFMVGLIWFVQIVHYPQFALVGDEHFVRYEAAHIRTTTYVVIIPMLTELATAALLAWDSPATDLRGACRVGLALVVVIWVSTLALQVPGHDSLARSFSVEMHRRLVLSNWIRTIAWSVRGGLMLYVLERMLAATPGSVGSAIHQ